MTGGGSYFWCRISIRSRQCPLCVNAVGLTLLTWTWVCRCVMMLRARQCRIGCPKKKWLTLKLTTGIMTCEVIRRVKVTDGVAPGSMLTLLIILNLVVLSVCWQLLSRCLEWPWALVCSWQQLTPI